MFMADMDASSYFVHMQEGGGIPLSRDMSTEGTFRSGFRGVPVLAFTYHSTSGHANIE